MSLGDQPSPSRTLFKAPFEAPMLVQVGLTNTIVHLIMDAIIEFGVVFEHEE